MPLRSVFIQFDSNLGSLSGLFKVAAAASDDLAKAIARTALASSDLDAASAKLMAVQNAALFDQKAYDAALEEGTAAKAAYIAATDAEAVAQEKSNVARMGTIGGITRVSGLLTAGLAFGLYETVKAAAAFDNQMRQAAAASDFTRDHLSEMSNAIIDLSLRTPQSADDLAKALTVVNQAGIQGAAALEAVKLAGEGATVGMGDVTTVAKGTVNILQSYGASSADLVGIQNTLIVAWKESTGSLDSLVKGMSAAAPTAAALHIPVNELAGAIAAMTRAGVDGVSAGQMLQRTLFYLETPTKELSVEVQKLGVAHGLAKDAQVSQVVQTLGLSNVIQGLNSEIGNNEDAWIALIPTIRTARTFFALSADEGQNYADVMSHLSDQQKIARESAIAVVEAQGSFSNQLKITENSVRAAGISMGQVMLPTVRSIAVGVGALADTFRDLPNAIQQTIGKGLALALGLGGVVVATGLVSKALIALEPILADTAAEFVAADVAMGPIALGIAGIAAGIAVFTSWRAEVAKNTQAIKDYTQAIEAEQSGTQGTISQLALENAVRSENLAWLDKVQLSTGQYLSLVTKEGDYQAARSEALKNIDTALNLNVESYKNAGSTAEVFAGQQVLLQGALAGSRDSARAFAAQAGDLGIISNKDGTQILNLASEISHYRDATKDAATQTKAHNDLISNQVNLLYSQNIAVTDEKGSIVELTTEQKALDTTMKQFGSSGAIWTAIMGDAKHSVENFTTASQIATQTITDLQNAQKVGVKTDKTDTKSTLDKQLQDAQDQSTALQRTDQDKTTALQATQRDRIQGIQDEISAAQDNASKIQENNATELSNLQNATQAQKDYYKQQDENARDVVSALQDKLKEQQRINQDETDSLQKSSLDAQRVQEDKVKTIQRTNADTTASTQDTTKKVGLSLDDYMKSLSTSAAAADTWHKNLDAIYAHAQKAIPDKADLLVKNLSSLGQQGADVVAKMATASDASLKTMADSFDTLSTDATVSFNEFKTELEKQVDDLASWQKNIAILSSRGEDNIAQKLIELGPKAAGLAADAVKQQKPVLDSVNTELQTVIDKTSAASVQKWTQGMDLLTQASKTGGKASIEALAAAMQGGLKPSQVQDIANNLIVQFKKLDVPIQTQLDLVPYVDPAFIKAHPELSYLNQYLTPPGSTRFTPGSGVLNTNAEGNIYAPMQGIHSFATGGGNDALDQKLQQVSAIVNGDRNAMQAIRNQLSKKEEHIAQIAKASDWRIWAEPETGGEAYIPLDQGKRGRSTDILNQVAHMFGYSLEKYADGGMTATTRSPVNSDTAISVNVAPISDHGIIQAINDLVKVVDDYAAKDRNIEQNFYEKIDPMTVARELAWASRR